MTELEKAMGSMSGLANEQVYLCTRTDAELLILAEEIFKDHPLGLELIMRWQSDLDLLREYQPAPRASPLGR